MGDWSALVGAGFIGFAVALVLTVGGIAIGCWVLYAIIWRAVRRGLREYNGEMRSFSTAEFLGMERRR